MPEATPLTDLLAQALRHLDEGGVEALEIFLGTHEQHAAALRSQLGDLQGVGMLRGAEDRTPDRLGEYVLQERLGVGGMGVVYRAVQESLQRQVALKLIRPEHLFFPESRRRFQREVEAIARLQHPGIVRVYEAGEVGNLPYFTMELVRGVPLSMVLQRLQEDRPARLDDRALRDALARLRDEEDPGLPLFQPTGRSWVEVCFRWAKSLAEALAYAHAAGVLHRDIKPSNVMLTWDGRVMLLDFGLASTDGGSRITKSGSMLGSLAYMAPEQVRGDHSQITPRTDVYGLGVTLYEMLALRHPFQDERAAGSERTTRRILDGHVPRLRDHGHAIPWDTETVCLAAIERDPARRYADAAAFARDLENVLCFRPIEARRPGLPLRLRRFTQRHPAASVGALLGLILLIAGPLGMWRAQVVKIRAVLAEQRKTEEALDTVARQRDEILGQSQRVMAQSELAKARFEKAVQIVADVSLQIGFVELRDVPEAGPVRHQLLEIAGRSARDLLAEIPDHPLAREIAARVDHHQGLLYLEEDRYDRARPLLESAKREFEELWETEPENLEVALQLGLTLNLLAVADHDVGDYDRAEDYYYEGIDTFEQALALTGPGELRSDLRRELASCLLNLGTMIGHQEGSREAGLETLIEARAVIELAVAEDPNFRNLSMKAVILNNLATKTDDPVEALELYREALEGSRAIERSWPGTRDGRFRLAVAIGNFGHQLHVQGTPESFAEADRLFDEALGRLRGLCRDYPDLDDYKVALASGLMNRGTLDDSMRRPADRIIPVLTECLEVFDPLCEKGFPAAHLNRGVVRQCLAGVLQEQGRHEEMRATYQRAVRDLQVASDRFPSWKSSFAGVIEGLQADFGAESGGRGDSP